jgi:hypothetical protein
MTPQREMIIRILICVGLFALWTAIVVFVPMYLAK